MKKRLLLFGALATLASAFAASAQNVPSYMDTTGLIGWWPFTGNADDESGNNNNGTNNGAALTTDRFGNANSAYLFDGTSSYISIPSSATLESPTRGLTMSAWIYLNGLSLVGQSYGPILTKSNSSANAFMYRFDIDINGGGYFAGTNNWTQNVGTGYTFLLNQWYLVSAVLDSDTTFLYLDDTLVATVPFTTNISLNSLPLEIGRDVPGITEIFNGKIDDIAIWKRALSHQEITDIYTSVDVGIKKPGIKKPLVIYPNPATDRLNVLVNEKLAGSGYVITDQSGRTVLKGKLKSDYTMIAIDNLATGIYMLSIGADSRQAFNVLRN